MGDKNSLLLQHSYFQNKEWGGTVLRDRSRINPDMEWQAINNFLAHNTRVSKDVGVIVIDLRASNFNSPRKRVNMNNSSKEIELKYS